MEKDGDPLGRIVHDYGFYQRGSYSVNAAHADTSTRYDSVRKRVLTLDRVRWYIKADLKNGYRQFGTHPEDWRFKVYCNGPNEHYIDLACPFGKTNSSMEFCPPVKLFAISAATRWGELHRDLAPKLSSYVDDVYGGIPDNDSYKLALELRDFTCDKGEELTLEFNKKPHKTPLPAKRQVILGCLYDSTLRRVMTTKKKVEKYVSRIDEALESPSISVRKLMSLHGNLTYAAVVAPFGRPFLAALSGTIVGGVQRKLCTSLN